MFPRRSGQRGIGGIKGVVSVGRAANTSVGIEGHHLDCWRPLCIQDPPSFHGGQVGRRDKEPSVGDGPPACEGTGSVGCLRQPAIGFSQGIGENGAGATSAVGVEHHAFPVRFPVHHGTSHADGCRFRGSPPRNGHVQLLQTVATVTGVGPDAFQVLGKRQHSKRFAVLESQRPDVRHACGNGHFLQQRAVLEGPVRNVLHAGRNDHGRQVLAGRKGCVADFHDRLVAQRGRDGQRPLGGGCRRHDGAVFADAVGPVDAAGRFRRQRLFRTRWLPGSRQGLEKAAKRQCGQTTRMLFREFHVLSPWDGNRALLIPSCCHTPHPIDKPISDWTPLPSLGGTFLLQNSGSSRSESNAATLLSLLGVWEFWRLGGFGEGGMLPMWECCQFQWPISNGGRLRGGTEAFGDDKGVEGLGIVRVYNGMNADKTKAKADCTASPSSPSPKLQNSQQRKQRGALSFKGVPLGGGEEAGGDLGVEVDGEGGLGAGDEGGAFLL